MLVYLKCHILIFEKKIKYHYLYFDYIFAKSHVTTKPGQMLSSVLE